MQVLFGFFQFWPVLEFAKNNFFHFFLLLAKLDNFLFCECPPKSTQLPNPIIVKMLLANCVNVASLANASGNSNFILFCNYVVLDSM